MRKSIFILFFALLGVLSAQAAYYDFEVDGIYYNYISGTDDQVEVTYRDNNYNSYSGSVVIPSTVTYSGTTYAVTSIGSSAFYNCSGLTSVTIPNSVTSIGERAFSRCTGLSSVTIPEGVTSIGTFTFYSCSGLTSVTIPESVTSIGSFAFEGCSSLTSVTIPNSVTSIENETFKNCNSLTSVTIPEGVTSIGEGAFSRCTGLSSVTISEGVTSIGSSAFYNCSGLTSVTIPESVTSIGSFAFEGCSSLTSVTIPNNVTSIKKETFKNCNSLTSVTIPESVTTIGEGAFEGCSSLTSVTIPNSVTTIGGSAFSNCSGLTSVTIPESVTSIGSSAFEYCSGLTSVTIPESVTSIGNFAFEGCSSLTSVTIPNSVTSIGKYTFYNCIGLTSVTIPESVTSIGDQAFQNCIGLTSVTIPESVTSIGSSAFSYCSGLTSVTIPESVTSIGEGAFQNCSKLTSVTIPESVTSIGKYTFYNCIGLTSVTIPNSVTSIGREAFAYTGLTSVTSLAQTPPVMGYHTSSGYYYGAFSDYSATLYVPKGCKEAYQAAEGWSSFSKIEELATVTLSVNNSEWGTVAGGGDDYEPGRQIAIEATPNEGYYFVKWDDENTDNPRILTVTGDVTLTAVFAPFIEVTLSATEGGTVTQSGNGTYKKDSTVIITATPNEGYRFVNWTKGNDVFSTDSMYTFTVNEDLTLVANFEEIPPVVVVKTYTVSVSANNAAWGSVSQSGNGIYDSATSVTITATPNEGYRFVNWTKADGSEFSTELVYTFTVTESLELTAHFEEIPPVVVVKTYTVSVSANNEAWGNVAQSGTGTYDSAASVTLTATPNEGYRFVNWTKEDGSEFSTDSLYTFIIMENLELLANFEKMPDTPIDPDTPTANEKSEADNLHIYVQDRTIYLSEERGTVQVYNMAGQRIYNGHATAIPVRQDGVYIVAVGQQRIKVVVR